MSPSDPQRRRNGQRGGMSLADQLCADLVIEFGILIQFPLAETLMCSGCASSFGSRTQAILRNILWPAESTILNRYLHSLLCNAL